MKLIEALALPADVVQFFQSVELSYDPTLTAQAGAFSIVDGRGDVRIRPVRFDSERPIILHELLHAYHFFKLGLDHPEVISAYRAALAANDSAVRVYFLANAKEFFAVTASFYLVGAIKQPPSRARASLVTRLTAHFYAPSSAPEPVAHSCMQTSGRPTNM